MEGLEARRVLVHILVEHQYGRLRLRAVRGEQLLGLRLQQQVRHRARGQRHPGSRGHHEAQVHQPAGHPEDASGEVGRAQGVGAVQHADDLIGQKRYQRDLKAHHGRHPPLPVPGRLRASNQFTA
eukprot:scaffold400085_cov41-Prasinocladus_malaysianus.AAC.1